MEGLVQSPKEKAVYSSTVICGNPFLKSQDFVGARRWNGDLVISAEDRSSWNHKLNFLDFPVGLSSLKDEVRRRLVLLSPWVSRVASKIGAAVEPGRLSV